jgi:F0F1-type ATP synthase assembly protein I
MAWDFRWIRKYSDFFYLGMLFPASIAVGVLMGFFADKWLHTDPWGKMLGFFFGVFAGSLNFYRDYKKMFSKNDESKKP